MPAPASTSKLVQFGVFELDLQRAELRKQGVRVKLQEQPLKVLQLLLENPGEIVSREQVRTRIWPANTFVEFDQGLYSAMARLRDARGDSSDSPRFIETVARRGYRFIAPVTLPSTQLDAETSESKPPTQVSRALVFRRLIANLLAGLVGGALVLATVLTFNIAGARDWLRRRTTPIRSLAVLPLENLSGDPQQEYFSDGMTDELITNLASIADLQVVSRSSTTEYKHTKKSLQQIGRELGVDAVVEGSVVRSGNRVRITAQLIQVATGRHLWAESYERDLGDVLMLQGEVAGAIVSEIKLKLSTAEQARLARARTVKPKAYQLYLQAQFLVDRPGKEDLEKSVDLFRQAAELDADYAPAWIRLAEAYMYQAALGYYQPEEAGWLKAREAAEHGLILDPNLAEAHAMIGEIQMVHDWDWQGADASLRQAMALEPSNAKVLESKADLAGFLGGLEEAMALDRRAIVLDPLSSSARLGFGFLAYHAGRLDESLAAIQKTLELNPDAGGAHWVLTLINLDRGHPSDALADARQERNPVFKLQALTLSYGALGQKKESDATLKELIAKVQIGGPFQIAEIYGFRGNAKQACDWLDRAYLQRDSGLPYVKQDRAFKKIDHDPRYVTLLKKMRLTD
jgi:TolB-like protein/DNA-binding winged helix-turn-helix (wHTH) protein/Tfp pilus assembly protein PilF